MRRGSNHIYEAPQKMSLLLKYQLNLKFSNLVYIGILIPNMIKLHFRSKFETMKPNEFI